LLTNQTNGTNKTGLLSFIIHTPSLCICALVAELLHKKLIFFHLRNHQEYNADDKMRGLQTETVEI
jgi:hypothetical protein